MCKIFTVTNGSKLNAVTASEAIARVLGKTDDDGFGYAALGAQGVFGEKSTSEVFQSQLGFEPRLPKELLVFSHEIFGKPSDIIGATMFHGRISTNKHGLINTHPMVKNDWYLIHNGVVTDHGPSYKQVTDNDSEHVLTRLIEGIHSVERYLTGYYAFTAIDPMGRLHVCRDAIASLYVSWSNVLDSHVFATSDDNMQEIAHDLGFDLEAIHSLQNDVYMIFEGNSLVHSERIRSRGYDRHAAQLSTLSLGRDITGHDMREAWDRDERFIDELSQIDDEYEIMNHDGEIIPASEFHKLDYISQQRCVVWRPDGTEVEAI